MTDLTKVPPLSHGSHDSPDDGMCVLEAEAMANLRLMAAAPELLDALKYLLSAHGEQLTDAFDGAYRAIAKAEGAIE